MGKRIAHMQIQRAYKTHSEQPRGRAHATLRRHGALRLQLGIGGLVSGLMSNYVICINNDSNPASLIVGKVYRTLLDKGAADTDMIRVVDEDTSEPEGYLYSQSMFAPIEVPEAAEAVLAR